MAIPRRTSGRTRATARCFVDWLPHRGDVARNPLEYCSHPGGTTVILVLLNEYFEQDRHPAGQLD
jgi:hypothetical protein